MPAPFSILALDLHNTLYDEVFEYGLAMEEAVAYWAALAQKRIGDVSHDTLYRELAVAHRKLGSDWDPDVWKHLPTLSRLGLSEAEFTRAKNEAESLRRKKSQQLTVSGLYEGVVETLTTLKAGGMRIFILTEATADAAMRAVTWLKLIGVVDGVYSYPSTKPPPVNRNTYHKPFPSLSESEHLRKPHPYLLAALVLDETIRRGEIPQDTPIGKVFGVSHDDTFHISELADTSPVQKDVSARLTIINPSYSAALRKTFDSILYVGDSKFKDGLLARHAGVAFGYAAYGKKVKEADIDDQRKSLRIMYAVSGWDPEVMKLTQEASKSEFINNLKADYTFENSLAETLPPFCSTLNILKNTMQTILLLIGSNIFMTFAWYGHLKTLQSKPLIVAILISWGIAFFEYTLQVPANRIGYKTFSLGQLKIIQEVITMTVFALFSYFYMDKALNVNFLYASLCMVGAAYFMFRA